MAYPLTAIRELIANALLYQDFDGGGRVNVQIYENSVVVSNPGAPNVAVDRFIDEQDSRNPDLVGMAGRLKLCEELGSGIDNVVESIEKNLLPPLMIGAGSRQTSATLLGPRQLDDMSMTERSIACYQHCALAYERGKIAISNSSVRERFGLSNSSADAASRIIQQCMTDGRIKLQDPNSTSKRYARYVPYWAS